VEANTKTMIILPAGTSLRVTNPIAAFNNGDIKMIPLPHV
jgi:hypothetical protein